MNPGGNLDASIVVLMVILFASNKRNFHTVPLSWVGYRVEHVLSPSFPYYLALGWIHDQNIGGIVSI